MPSYNALPVSVIYPGNNIALVSDASTDTGVTTTQQTVIGPSNSNANVINIINTTNQTAQGQLSWDDTTGDYQNASGMMIGSGSALCYNLADGFLRFTFSTAPTSGSLVVAR